MILDQQLEGGRAARKIVADRRGQHEQGRLGRRRRRGADVLQRTDERRAQVKRRRRFRNVREVVLHEVDHHAGKQVGIRNGQDQRRGTPAHPGDVIVQTEDAPLAVSPAVGLETFEAAARVVQDMGGRVQRQRRQRFD